MNPVGAENTHRDALDDVNQRNRIFVEQAPNALAMFDTDMRYLAASQQWIKDYRLEGINIIGRSHYEIFPEIGEDWKQIHRECLAGAINKNDNAYFRRADGTEQWLEWDVRPWYLSEGVVGGLLMYTADITGRKVMESQLAQSQQQLRAAFEYSATGMAIVALDGSWLQVNDTLCDILGYGRAELLSMKFPQITYRDDLEKDLQLTAELIEGKRNFYYLEKRYIHKNSNLVWAILCRSVIRDKNGKPLYFATQVTDINKQKAAQEQLQSTLSEMSTLLSVTSDQNERLKNFAHIVAHNLRSHSGNLGALLDIFFDENPQMADNEMLQLFRTATDSLKETVNQLSDIVVLKTTVADNLVPLNLRAAIEATTKSISILAKDAGVTITDEVDEHVNVMGIAAYLDSVLLNFLTNSIKYRSAGRECYVKLSAAAEGNMIMLSIEDNGLGMDMSKVGGDLFGMYKTFHGNTDARGIGLFITHNQVEAMGGKIEAVSEVDKGTTFRVWFRVAE